MSALSQSRQKATTQRIIALTGFMGAGKTSVGRALAAILGWSFVDLDEEVERGQKMAIHDLFRLHGERHFREVETGTLWKILADVTAPTVIALGGGTFIQMTNVEMLRDSGARVVFLDTPIDKMLERCRIKAPASAENLRPLAADPDAFRALYAERVPRYRTADVIVSTAGRTAEENARAIADSLHLGETEP